MVQAGHVTRMGDKCIHNFGGEPEKKKRDFYVDLGVDGRIILKYISER
jgi:hypothetical protein